ncbi:MAG: hypothetical protein JXA41_13025 [Deltaproteobacteria bacterium]|nr:hypothetical protein [Deltaproteobacteria bacterium]
MCDTCGIGPELTGSGISIFGKNSDREADETQLVISLPAKEYRQKEDLRCTYIAIPQVESTYALVISKPFWLWGAEMGVHEKGVVIGNEALFTEVKPEKSPGLIGGFDQNHAEKTEEKHDDDIEYEDHLWDVQHMRSRFTPSIKSYESRFRSLTDIGYDNQAVGRALTAFFVTGKKTFFACQSIVCFINLSIPEHAGD